MTPAGQLQNKLLSMAILSPWPDQESLPLGSAMQAAIVALLGKTFERFLAPRGYPPLLLYSQAIETCKKFGGVFPGRSVTLLAQIACIEKGCE